jgi:hypothetical protein
MSAPVPSKIPDVTGVPLADLAQDTPPKFSSSI